MLKPQNAPPAVIGQENLLLDYIQRLERHKAGRRAMYIHLSALQPVNRREHHIRMAASTFDNLVKQMLGQLFQIGNSDMIFVFKSSALDDVEACIVKLRFLFSDDPLINRDPEARNTGFVSWYNLEADYGRLLHLSQQLLSEEEERRAAEQRSQYGDRPKPVRGQPLTSEMLGKIQEALLRADLSNHMRRQAVCALVGKSPPQPVFNELFISIADLRETLLPDVNLNSSPWLFQQLTETLDRRVLSLLNRHDDRTLAGDISINLNVGTLLSPEFLVFDDNVKAGMRGTIVIELQKVDIFADLGAYMFARDFAHDRGYRICVDGLSWRHLPFVDRERLGADLVKIMWEANMPTLESDDGQRCLALLHRAGGTRVILCRVDDQNAVDWGHNVGVTLFQGRFIEATLVQEIKKRGTNFRRSIRR